MEAEEGPPSAPAPRPDVSAPAPRLDASRRWTVAAAVYLALTAVYFACASHERIVQHTPYNHFALQARAWLDGHLYLSTAPPVYAHGNDFAFFEGHWYIVFPSFPAVLLLPAVAVAESVEKVRDGQIFLWFAGAGPALVYLVLERLRDLGRTSHGERTNAALALLFGLGTVYWFTAEQGTVWFAAHVIGVSLAALYTLFSLGGRRPFLAGLCLGLAFWTRSPLIFALPLFLLETAGDALRRGTFAEALGSFGRRLLLFALPLSLLVGLSLAHNQARFHDPFEVGYRFLQVGWQARMERWGLFSYHYLARNLGVLLTSLPFYSRQTGFQISLHGLALWLTTPVYLYLFRPRRWGSAHLALAVTAACVMLPSLLYQNSGQSQFGYRFSSDYAVFLFALLALGQPRLRPAFWVLAAWGVALNGFGALTFERPDHARYYTGDLAIYPPD
jgi:hypothetical protein